MAHQLKQHRMSYTTNIAKTAASDVTQFLEDTWPQTVVEMAGLPVDVFPMIKDPYAIAGYV